MKTKKFKNIKQLNKFVSKSNKLREDHYELQFARYFCSLIDPDIIKLEFDEDFNEINCKVKIIVNNIEYRKSGLSSRQVAFYRNGKWVNELISDVVKEITGEYKSNIYSKLDNNIPFSLEEILDVNINKTVLELCEFTNFGYENGVFNKLYPNSYKYSFDDMKNIELNINIHRFIFNESNPLIKDDLYLNIETVNDYLKFVNKILLGLNNTFNYEFIVKIILSATYFNNNTYNTLKNLYPDMGWEKEYMEQTDGYISNYLYGDELKIVFTKYFKENIIFRAIMLSDTMKLGPFYGMDSDYFLYLLKNKVPNCLNMNYEDMKEYLNELSITWCPEYIKETILDYKEKHYKDLSVEDLNYVIEWAISNYKKKDDSRYSYMSIFISDLFFKSLKKKYPNKEVWFNSLPPNLVEEMVKNENYKDICKNIALLMDKDYQLNWQRETKQTLNNVNIEPINWNEPILCIITHERQEYT